MVSQSPRRPFAVRECKHFVDYNILVWLYALSVKFTADMSLQSGSVYQALSACAVDPTNGRSWGEKHVFDMNSNN